jgi:proteasome component ECM29
VAVGVRALAALLPVIAKRGLDRGAEEGLEKLIVEQMITEKGSARFLVVRYANRILEFRNVVGRCMNLLAARRKGERGEVVEEAKKGTNDRERSNHEPA